MIRRASLLALPVLALTGALLGVAPTATADIVPDPVGWITAAGETIDWRTSSDLWSRSATVVADGVVAGHPGNRHTATVVANPNALGSPRPGPLVLTITLTLRDENCSAGGACSTLWAGTGTLPNIADIPVPAADGSVRLQAPVPASVFTTTEPAGAPVPLADSVLDAVLTPRDWRDPRARDTLTSQNTTRYAATQLPGGGVDSVSVDSDFQGTGTTATGVVAGVPAQRVTDGTWRDRGGAAGSAGPGLPPVRTYAESEPYLPTVRNGRVNRLSYAAGYWDGEVGGRGPLRTSTGQRLPGNTWRASLYSQVVLQPGDPVAGRRAEGANLGLESKQCAAGQAWDDCAATPGPLVYAGVPATYRYSIDFGRAIEYRFTVPMLEQQPSGEAKNLGTLAVRVTVRPNGPGEGTWIGSLTRGTQNSWQFTATLRRPVTGEMTVAGRPVSAPTSNNTRFIEFATIGSGNL